jgi:hypothetical protein
LNSKASSAELATSVLQNWVPDPHCFKPLQQKRSGFFLPQKYNVPPPQPKYVPEFISNHNNNNRDLGFLHKTKRSQSTHTKCVERETEREAPCNKLGVEIVPGDFTGLGFLLSLTSTSLFFHPFPAKSY